MRSVTELYGRHEGEDIYVVGSGASMRVFPADYLRDKVTIGLNMAWRSAPVRYGLTIGPHLNVPEFIEGEEPRPDITWITREAKARAVLDDEQFAHADATFYGFSVDAPAPDPAELDLDEPPPHGRRLDWVRHPSENLYVWSSISQTALNLAANMGARTVVLVGCDNCSLNDNHHGHLQHTKWLGAAPERRYEQYYEGLAEVRAVLRERGVDVVSLTPFVKLDDPGRDFGRLCDELERPELLQGPDISDEDHPSRFLQGRSGRGAQPAGLTGRVRRRASRLVRRARA